MAFGYATVAPGTGGGGGQNLSWRRDEFPQTTPFFSGLLLNLSGQPVHETSVQVWSQGEILHPNDYIYNPSGPTVEILFSADPANDTDTGVWEFFLTYPYVL